MQQSPFHSEQHDDDDDDGDDDDYDDDNDEYHIWWKTTRQDEREDSLFPLIKALLKARKHLCGEVVDQNR